jgi:hypothetical protein
MRLLSLLRCIVAVAGVARVGLAQSLTIPDAEINQPPTMARLATIQAAARRDGWSPQIAGLRAAAVQAYGRDRVFAAEAWFHVYRLAGLFAETDAEFAPRWIAAVNAAKVGYANLPHHIPMGMTPLGAKVSPELQTWLIGNPGFSTGFFNLLSPVDYLPQVFEILTDLYRADPARFQTYAHLALAIAVVYDVPPPPFWPHNQVSDAVLPRQFPRPRDAFAWWIRQEQLGRTYHRLARLSADELKFVVDAAAPFPELEWSQQVADYPLAQLARTYSMIRYRLDRITGERVMWPGHSYKLPDILATGGICVDQAYFATQVGKARGVPTLLFYGAGNDGRHAWFGYLDGNQKWQLDAGRYAEQRFITGFARDPQTWREFSDHELQFLSEHFRALDSYRQSRIHEEFAADFLVGGDVHAAALAARKAVNFERRNQAGWETLITAAQQEHRDAKTTEALLREAALAFQRYPDLEAYYVTRVSESLRSRGQISEADAEVRRIARKNQSSRSDISVQQGRDILLRSMATQPLPDQIRTYNSVVDSFGAGAGVAFFDQVVTVFVEHLLQLQQKSEATRALERARRALKFEPNSQMAGDFVTLQKSIVEQK